MATQSGGGHEEGGPFRKVIVRYSDGRVLRAYLPAEYQIASAPQRLEVLALQDVNGASLDVGASEIKAIFLVKSFEGNPNYVEFKNFPQRPGGPGLWLSVVFKDRESLEGVAPNSLATFIDTIFFMTPPDPRSNNQAVLVSKTFLADMQILGFQAAQ
jgi:Family of unknown function (DUF6982)